MTIENSQNSVKLCLLSSTAANNAIKFESFIHSFRKLNMQRVVVKQNRKKKEKYLKFSLIANAHTMIMS